MPKSHSHKHRFKHLNFDRVDRYIMVGTTICCRYHFESLLKLGMKADIDMQEEKIDKPSGVESFLWLPTKDFFAPSPAQLTIGAHFIEDMVNHRMMCYVHCNEGHGRAPTIVAAYYILADGMTPRQAVAHIKKERPAIHPNVRQMAALAAFHTQVKKDKIYGRTKRGTK